MVEPYAGVDITHLISYHSQLRSQLSTPTKKGKGVEWGKSLLLVGLGHIVSVCYFLKSVFNVNTITQYRKRGREGVRANLMSLNRHFMEHVQPHA
jgi:hypothetical protein